MSSNPRRARAIAVWVVAAALPACLTTPQPTGPASPRNARGIGQLRGGNLLHEAQIAGGYGRVTTLGSRDRMALVSSEGHVTPPFAASDARVSDYGIHADIHMQLEIIEQARIVRVSPEVRALLSQTSPRGTQLHHRPDGMLILHAPGGRLAEWMLAFLRRAGAARGGAAECRPDDEGWRLGMSCAVDGMDLGYWAFGLSPRLWSVPVRTDQLRAVVVNGVRVFAGWPWSEIARVRVNPPVGGPRSPRGGRGALHELGVGRGGDEYATGGRSSFSESGVGAVARGAGTALLVVAALLVDAIEADRPAAPDPDPPPPAWAPAIIGRAPSGDRPLFSGDAIRFAPRQAIFSTRTSFDARTGSELWTTVTLGGLIQDHELAVGYGHFSSEGVTRRNYVMARYGYQIGLDGGRRYSIPLGVEAGMSGAAAAATGQAYLGFRWRPAANVCLGVYPFNPTFNVVADEDPEDGVATGSSRWSFNTGLELGFAW